MLFVFSTLYFAGTQCGHALPYLFKVRRVWWFTRLVTHPTNAAAPTSPHRQCRIVSTSRGSVAKKKAPFSIATSDATRMKISNEINAYLSHEKGGVVRTAALQPTQTSLASIKVYRSCKKTNYATMRQRKCQKKKCCFTYLPEYHHARVSRIVAKSNLYCPQSIGPVLSNPTGIAFADEYLTRVVCVRRRRRGGGIKLNIIQSYA